LLKFPED